MQNHINLDASILNAKPYAWINPNYMLKPHPQAKNITQSDIADAENRLRLFAPFIVKHFPETLESNGIIESDLVLIDAMKEMLNNEFGAKIKGNLYLKKDSDLPIAGSIKARGGIYEVLKHTEDLALKHGLIQYNDNYEKLADITYKNFFSDYKIQVGSTGNLGLSIGIISAAIGYEVIVHMSADAKQWKKDLLKAKGVTVKEYQSDYNAAVENGRKESDTDPKSYFIDDENSVDLFLGYCVAAKRLKQQLDSLNILVDQQHPLFVYIPCGVGGAPGGVSYGLNMLFGKNVHCFFIEPTEAPCMLVGMATGKHNLIDVKDIGLTGLTEADGLAVSRPSALVGKIMQNKLSGIFTLNDVKLKTYLNALQKSENIYIEPSACAAFEGPTMLMQYNQTQAYISDHNLDDKLKNATHIAWATGGSLVPNEFR